MDVVLIQYGCDTCCHHPLPLSSGLQVRDHDRGEAWYFNPFTGKSQWDRPDSLLGTMTPSEKARKSTGLRKEHVRCHCPSGMTRKPLVANVVGSVLRKVLSRPFFFMVSMRLLENGACSENARTLRVRCSIALDIESQSDTKAWSMNAKRPPLADCARGYW